MFHSGRVKRGIFSLVGVSLLLIVLWPFYSSFKKSRAQKRAIRVIEKMGGKVSGRRVRFPGTRLVVGRKMTSIRFEHFDFAEKDLSCLQEMRSTIVVHLGFSRQLDEGLYFLKMIPKVENLYMTMSDVSSVGLKELKGHPTVRYISLGSKKIDREMLEALAEIPNLQFLDLSRSDFDPIDLQVFSTHPNLKNLYVNRTTIDDGDVEAIAKLPQLARLKIRKTKLSPKGIVELQRRLPSTKIEL